MKAQGNFARPVTKNALNMNLKEYSKKIQALAKKYPNAAVIYASDDEGNCFNLVANEPSTGFFYDVCNGEVILGEAIEMEPELHENNTDLVEAVCIN